MGYEMTARDWGEYNVAKLERHRCRGSISIHFFLFLFLKSSFWSLFCRSIYC